LTIDHIKRPSPPLSPFKKEVLIARISSLLRDKGCVLAVLFGSFLNDKPFRDIDICVALRDKRPATPADLLYLAQLLEKETGYPLDIVSIDVPNMLLRAEIAKQGHPILLEDEKLWDDFRFYAWIDGMDFRSRIERFYEERFHDQ
jgi:predicted nucleotidyltransferase